MRALVLALAGALAAPATAAAQLAASPGYQLLDWDVGAAGGPTSSLSYAAAGMLLEAGGMLSSPGFTAAVGFLAANDPQPTNAPLVFAVTPGFGPKAGGTPVVVAGMNFDALGAAPTLVASMGGTAVAATVLSNTELSLTSPAGANGPGDVTISTLHGSDTEAGGFVWTPAVVSSPQVVIGGSLEIANYGAVGGLFEQWFSPVATSIPLPPYGTILIGPSPAAKAYGGSYPAPGGVHQFTLGVPDDPALHGKVVHYQTISIPSFAPLVIELTNRSTTTVL